MPQRNIQKTLDMWKPRRHVESDGEKETSLLARNRNRYSPLFPTPVLAVLKSRIPPRRIGGTSRRAGRGGHAMSSTRTGSLGRIVRQDIFRLCPPRERAGGGRERGNVRQTSGTEVSYPIPKAAHPSSRNLAPGASPRGWFEGYLPGPKPQARWDWSTTGQRAE